MDAIALLMIAGVVMFGPAWMEWLTNFVMLPTLLALMLYHAARFALRPFGVSLPE